MSDLQTGSRDASFLFWKLSESQRGKMIQGCKAKELFVPSTTSRQSLQVQYTQDSPEYTVKQHEDEDGKQIMIKLALESLDWHNKKIVRGKPTIWMFKLVILVAASTCLTSGVHRRFMVLYWATVWHRVTPIEITFMSSGNCCKNAINRSTIINFFTK